jgi:hypothetical protein
MLLTLTIIAHEVISHTTVHRAGRRTEDAVSFHAIFPTALIAHASATPPEHQPSDPHAWRMVKSGPLNWERCMLLSRWNRRVSFYNPVGVLCRGVSFLNKKLLMKKNYFSFYGFGSVTEKVRAESGPSNWNLSIQVFNFSGLVGDMSSPIPFFVSHIFELGSPHTCVGHVR